MRWTPELIGRGGARYPGFAAEPPEQFLKAVRAEVEEWAEELVRRGRRLEREAAAVAGLLGSGTSGQAAERGSSEWSNRAVSQSTS